MTPLTRPTPRPATRAESAALDTAARMAMRLAQPLSGWSTLLAAGLVALLTAGAIAQLRQFATDNLATHDLLLHIDLLAHRLNALQWEAIAEGRLHATLELSARQARSEMGTALGALAKFAAAREQYALIEARHGDYVAATNAALRLLEQGRLGEARALNAARVDPAYTWLHDTLQQVSSAHEERALRATRLANLGSLAVLLVATGAVMFLFWGRDRAAQVARLALAKEAVRRESERRFRALVHNTSDAILLVDAAGRIDYVTESGTRLLGAPPDACAGTALTLWLHTDDDAQAGAFLARCASTGEPVEGPTLRTRPGPRGVRQLEIVGNNQLADAALHGIVLTCRDITERVAAQQALHDSEELHRVLFECNPQPMWVCDCENGRFLAVNDAAVALYQYCRDELMTLNPAELFVHDAGDEVACRTEIREGASRQRKKDGTLIDAEITCREVRFAERHAHLVLARDVTERRRLEEQLRQSQKLEAIGALAGGVAHDFNNLLNVITGFGEMLAHDLGPEHRGQRRLEQIRKAAARAAELTRQLLAFSRKQVLQPKLVSLGDIVLDLEKMLRRLIGEHIELVTRAAPRQGYVMADKGQIEQVIVNLAVNARDAMPSGGQLLLETSQVEIDEAWHLDLAPGPYVMLSVTDTGRGMDNETLAHIFEPFFTTKEVGKGTGLGLATVYGIVKQSGGHIWLASEPGRGSTFKIYLPRATSPETTQAEAAPPAEPTASRAATVLLVEDEPSLREVVREILEEGGYTVVAAERPEQALALAQSRLDAIDVVLTDVVMPGMTGPEMIRRLAARCVAIKVLYMSGYTDSSFGQAGLLDAQTHLLQKPFTGDLLLRRLREILETAGASKTV